MHQTSERLREIANALDQFRTAKGENHFAIFAKELRAIAKAEEVHESARRGVQEAELARVEREARAWRRRYQNLRSQITAALVDTRNMPAQPTSAVTDDTILAPEGPPPVEAPIQPPPPRRNASKVDDFSHPAFA